MPAPSVARTPKRLRPGSRRAANVEHARKRLGVAAVPPTVSAVAPSTRRRSARSGRSGPRSVSSPSDLDVLLERVDERALAAGERDEQAVRWRKSGQAHRRTAGRGSRRGGGRGRAGRGGAGGAAVVRGEGVGDGRLGPPPAPDLEQRPDDGADHAVHEAVGRDLEAPVAGARPRGATGPTQRRMCGWWSPSCVRQNALHSCRPTSACAARFIASKSVGGAQGDARAARRARAPTSRRGSGTSATVASKRAWKPAGRALGAADGDGRRQQAAERGEQPPRVDVAVGRRPARPGRARGRPCRSARPRRSRRARPG